MDGIVFNCEAALAAFEDPSWVAARIDAGYYEPAHHATGSDRDYWADAGHALGRIRPGLTAKGYTEIIGFGSGGMGAVFSAKDPLGNPVVIKTPLANTPRLLRLFRSERDFSISLSQREKTEPQKYFLEVPDGAPTELATEGGSSIPVLITKEVPRAPGSEQNAVSLDHYSPNFFAENPDVRAAVQQELRAAVKRVHESDLGLIHRDLKPENILVYFDEQGEAHVKIIDLGLAAATRGVHPDQIGLPFATVAAGMMTGTMGYASPSQIRNQPSTPKDDLFALRFLDWYLRSGSLRPDQAHGKIARNKYPNAPLPPGWKFTPRVLIPELGTYYEPRVAMDHTAADGKLLPTRERMIAMAEFSNWPQTVDERNDLIHRAETETPKEFFKWYVPKVLDLDSRSAINRGPYQVRYQAARELLNSTILPLAIQSEFATPMERSVLEALVRGYYLNLEEAASAKGDPTTQGPFDGHPHLNFKQFDELVQYLVDNRKIGDPARLHQEAKELREKGIRYY